ncbi:MAG: ribonuclease PH [Prochlorothrix sp.]
MSWQRPDGRTPQQLRPVQFHHQFTRFAPGSVLVEFGQTRVLCTVSVAHGVPRFLEGSGQGWLTAEYRMLPGATQERKSREWLKLSGRTQEIQRLIGRSLRAALNFQTLGEYTLTVDADVLQADGGTRTAAITGGFVALKDAIDHLMGQELLTQNPIQRSIAAISVGLIEGEAFLDLNYPEDVAAEVDLNVVMTDALELIEIQGTAEEQQFSRSQLNQMLDFAEGGIRDLFKQQVSSM